MKCRMYVNGEQEKILDNILYGLKVAHNVILHDMFEKKINTKEKKDKDGKIIHYPDLNQAASASYLNKIRSEHPIINNVPASALSSNNGIIKNDIKKSLTSQVNKGNSLKGKVIKPVEFSKPTYYSKSHPRMSYTYQDSFTKIVPSTSKVCYMTLNKIGRVKIRGWNTSLRFGESKDQNFVEYATNNNKKLVTITIEKDNCGDFWIIFKLANVYKPICEEKTKGEVGIDVGIKDIVILSNGKKYENKNFKRSKKKRLKALNRRLARRYGYANEKFRDDQKKNFSLKPSKRYELARLSHAKLHRKIYRKRENYYNNLTTEIVANNSFIGVETLNVTGMFRNRHLAYALSDVSMGKVLEMITYKSKWYSRKCVSIDRWSPSSKRCSVCGYIYKDLTLNIREWDCPVCGVHHDRDINAAENIHDYAKEIAS